MIQTDLPTPILLASYETTAKDFLYPYSSDRIEYTGLRRYILLNRTIDFPGISPSLEFSTSPSIDDVTGLSLTTNGYRRQTKTVRFLGINSSKENLSLAIRSNDRNHQHGKDHLHLLIGN